MILQLHDSMILLAIRNDGYWSELNIMFILVGTPQQKKTERKLFIEHISAFSVLFVVDPVL